MASEHEANVILFFDHTAKMGGGELALLNLVTHLNRARYEPLVVLASDGQLSSRLRAANVETIILPLPPSVTETRKESLGPASFLKIRQAVVCLIYAWKLAKLAKKRKAAIIHCNSLKADMIGGIAARMARLPSIWHVRDHINGEYLPPVAAQIFKAFARRIPTAVIANSDSTLSQLELPDRRRVHLGVAYSGIEFDAYADPPTDPMPTARDVKIVLVGRITPWKGQDVFLRAAALVAREWPSVRFQIVGTPLFGEHDYEQSLHNMVEDLAITDRVDFLGFRDDVPEILTGASVVLHASTIGEPFGRVVVEGMAAAKPVIATDGGALREIVVTGPIDGPPAEDETGFLVPMGDHVEMAAAIRALLRDPRRAAAMGRAGRERAATRFTIANTVKSVEAMYDQLLGAASSPRDTQPPERRSRAGHAAESRKGPAQAGINE